MAATVSCRRDDFTFLLLRKTSISFLERDSGRHGKRGREGGKGGVGVVFCTKIRFEVRYMGTPLSYPSSMCFILPLC